MTELMRRATNQAVSIAAVKEVARLTRDTRLEQANIRAISAVTEFAVSEVIYLKKIQNLAEQGNLDAADAVANIIGIAVVNIARRVGHFGSEVA